VLSSPSRPGATFQPLPPHSAGQVVVQLTLTPLVSGAPISTRPASAENPCRWLHPTLARSGAVPISIRSNAQLVDVCSDDHQDYFPDQYGSRQGPVTIAARARGVPLPQAHAVASIFTRTNKTFISCLGPSVVNCLRMRNMPCRRLQRSLYLVAQRQESSACRRPPWSSARCPAPFAQKGKHHSVPSQLPR
jgi:hypothetical protein